MSVITKSANVRSPEGTSIDKKLNGKVVQGLLKVRLGFLQYSPMNHSLMSDTSLLQVKMWNLWHEYFDNIPEIQIRLEWDN